MRDVLKIAICEDTDSDAARLISYIEEIEPNADITRFESGEFLLAFLDEEENADVTFEIIFMDIYMNELNGMDTARELRDRGVESSIIFTTTSPDFSLDAFDVDAEQYLLKPIERDGKLEKIFTKHTLKKSKAITVNAKGAQVELNPKDIMYIESIGHNCRIHTSTDTLDTGRFMTLDSFEKLLAPPKFLRCHRSYIVNLSYVGSLEEDFIMKNGDTVYIRRGDFSKIKKRYLTWLLDEAADTIL